jgi:hypothetical protein
MNWANYSRRARGPTLRPADAANGPHFDDGPFFSGGADAIRWAAV